MRPPPRPQLQYRPLRSKRRKPRRTVPPRCRRLRMKERSRSNRRTAEAVLSRKNSISSLRSVARGAKQGKVSTPPHGGLEITESPPAEIPTDFHEGIPQRTANEEIDGRPDPSGQAVPPVDERVPTPCGSIGKLVPKPTRVIPNPVHKRSDVETLLDFGPQNPSRHRYACASGRSRVLKHTRRRRCYCGHRLWTGPHRAAAH